MLKAHEEKMSREELLRNYSRVKKRCVELVLECDDMYELLGKLLWYPEWVKLGWGKFICPLCAKKVVLTSEDKSHYDNCPRKRAEELLKRLGENDG